VLFVNGTAFGGSLLSTRALCRVLEQAGVPVGVLRRSLAGDRIRAIHKRLENLRARAAGSSVEGAADRLVRLPGGRASEAGSTADLLEWEAVEPANALGSVIDRFNPDVVVVASVLRPAWRQMQADLRARSIPSVLYLREGTALLHLTRSKVIPDLILANSGPLVADAEAAGFSVEMIPSVIDPDEVVGPTSRERALVINLRPDYGGELAWAIAAICPDIPFAFQESWQDGSEDLQRARLRAQGLPNVEVRGFTTPPREVYRDAKVLLLPYPAEKEHHRPRCVLEAQLNGIPIVASALPGLAEVTGPGGELVPLDATDAQWADVVRQLWTDRSRYERLADAARCHARREGVDAERIAQRFLRAVAAIGPEPPDHS
jgi:hypothetical protein